MSRTDIVVASGGIELAGSVWTPDSGASGALIIMYPGSGPSDRDNDVFFPPIRAAFLEAGAAVASFDKRGVGGSSGDWTATGIEDQADDLRAFLPAARSVVPHGSLGLFGHSQGGWVVLAAAAAASPDFVITSSGPSVTPRAQEAYSTRAALEALGHSAGEVNAILATYDELFDLAQRPWRDVSDWMDQPGRSFHFAALGRSGAFVPDGPEVWRYASLIIDHDPEPALRALDVPLLAVLGSEDGVVPVEDSVAAYRRLVRPDLLTLEVIDGGDHRIQNPESGELVDAYIPTLITFLRRIDA